MKKVLSLLLVLVLALGMSTTAFASWKTDKTQPEKATTMGGGIGGGSLDIGTFSPVKGNGLGKQEFYITIAQTDLGVTKDPGINTWADTASNGVTKGTVMKADISASKITLKTKISKGSAVFDEVKFEYNTVGGNKVAQILVEFMKPFKSNNDDGVDFEITPYFVVDGKSWVDNGLTLTGTYGNALNEDVDADTTLFDMSDGDIMKPSEYVKSIELDLGEGVSVFGRAIKGTKYWAVADKDASAAEDEMMVKYGIDDVYHLQNINVAGIANYVMLNDADPSAYVYDGDLKYLGQAKEKLAFAETYYLSAKKLDVDDDEDIEPDDGDDYPVAPPVTGGDGYPENINDNPGTGR